MSDVEPTGRKPRSRRRVRPFRRHSLTRLIAEIAAWNEVPVMLMQLAMELEFRGGGVAAVAKAHVVERIAAFERDHIREHEDQWCERQSLASPLSEADRRLKDGALLLLFGGFRICEALHPTFPRRSTILGAIAYADVGRLETDVGAPGSMERCRLLIDVFTYAIHRVRSEGLDRDASAGDRWPGDRKVVVQEMQRLLRGHRRSVTS